MPLIVRRMWWGIGAMSARRTHSMPGGNSLGSFAALVVSPERSGSVHGDVLSVRLDVIAIAIDRRLMSAPECVVSGPPVAVVTVTLSRWVPETGVEAPSSVAGPTRVTCGTSP
ncbi:hypothetical protein ACRS6B_17085 [Nocardia asteroides]